MKLTSAVTILSLVQVAIAQNTVAPGSVFPRSLYETERDRLEAEYLDDLDTATGYGDNLLDRMLDDNIINLAGDSRLALIKGYSILDPVNVLVKPADCGSDSFGRSGNYTIPICHAVDQVEDVCNAENLRGVCDLSQVPGVISASNDDFLQTPTDGDITGTPKFELMLTAVCINRVIDPRYDDKYTLDLCKTYALSDSLDPTEATDIKTRVENYNTMMIFLPPKNQFWNPLWTNTAGATVKEIDPNADFVIGDGYLQIAEKAWDVFEDRPGYAKPGQTSGGHRESTYAKTLVIDTLVQQFTVESQVGASYDFSDADKNQFYKDVVRGYFFQRYSNEFFSSKSEKKVLMDGALLKYDTGCAVPLGALMSKFCDVAADEIFEYMEAYYIQQGDLTQTVSGTQACEGKGYNARQCGMVGIYGDSCCTWDSSTSTCTSNTAFCVTNFCKDWTKQMTWKAKRSVAVPTYPGIKRDAAACFTKLGF